MMQVQLDDERRERNAAAMRQRRPVQSAEAAAATAAADTAGHQRARAVQSPEAAAAAAAANAAGHRRARAAESEAATAARRRANPAAQRRRRGAQQRPEEDPGKAANDLVANDASWESAGVDEMHVDDSAPSGIESALKTGAEFQTCMDNCLQTEVCAVCCNYYGRREMAPVCVFDAFPLDLFAVGVRLKEPEVSGCFQKVPDVPEVLEVSGRM
jgi:hypothetical protein